MATNNNDSSRTINVNDITDNEQSVNFNITEDRSNEIQPNNDVINALEQEEDMDFNSDDNKNPEENNGLTINLNCSVDGSKEPHTGGNVVSQTLEEQILPQQLSQLSTTRKNQEQQNLQLFGKIPNYLSDKNESFQKMINEILSTMMMMPTTTTTTTISLSLLAQHEEELRQIAVLTHRIISEQIFQSLWIIDLKAGMGQLKINQTGPSIWPTKVKTMVKQAINAGANENDACMTLVQDRLRQINEKIEKFQTEINIRKNRLQGDTETIYQTIQTFIQQKLELLRQKIEHKIALVKYDYNDRALELEFLQQNPSAYCIKLYKHLYYVTYKQDVTREEVALVKQRIAFYNDNPRLHFRHIRSTFINTINNPDIQQQLYNQLTNAVEQAKVDMFNLYVKTAETQMNHYNHQHLNKELDRIFRESKSLPMDQRLTTVMFNLLEQRVENRKERIQCVNQFKIHCLHSNSAHY